MFDRGDRSSSSRSGQLASSGFDCVRPPTSEGHNSFVRTPFWVFLYSMESPLSQESIHMPDEGNRCQTEVLDRVYQGQLSSVSQLGWV